MPFAKIQGHKIVILHSRRSGRRVEQVKLYEFRTGAEALACVEAAGEWERLCESLVTSLGKPARLDAEELRRKIRELAEQLPAQDAEPNPVEELALRLTASLQSFEAPLTGKQRRMLGEARKALVGAMNEIVRKLELLGREKPRDEEDDEMEDMYTPGSAERLFDQGLTHHERGEWDEAKAKFLAGLKLAPEHTDLLVHAGNCELQDGNLSLALQYFSRAAGTGHEEVQALIEKEPGFYVTEEAKRKFLSTMKCQAPEEHMPRHDGPCGECEEEYRGRVGSFRNHLEVRPFLRALHNQALVLMKLGRYQEALEVLREYERYQDNPGNWILAGQCHLGLGNLREAKRWCNALLWASACYYRALILSRLEETQEALAVLIRGIFWNPHIARMLVGREEPEKVRWVGSALPRRLEASEFYHEERAPFQKDAHFKALVRLVLDDTEIQGQLRRLEEEIARRDTDRNYRMEPVYWGLFTGSASSEELVQGHATRLAGKVGEPGSGYWLPRVGERLKVELEEAKTVNWRVRLCGKPGTVLYLRGAGVEAPGVGHRFDIRVERTWRHRHSVFVMGEVTGV